MGSSVANLQCICTAKLLFDICDNTHLSFLICFDRYGHKTLVLLLHRRTLVDDKVTNLFSVSESVVQLDTITTSMILTVRRSHLAIQPSSL